MIKKWGFYGVTLLLFGLMIRAGAQDNPLKIACVDLDRIMAESGTIRNIIGVVQDDIKKEQESLAEKMTSYKVLAQTLENQKTILTGDQIKTRRQELDDLKISIEDQQQDINRMIRRSERDLVEPAINLVNRAIKEVSENENLDLVLRNDLILFASDRCNITDAVIRKLDDLHKQETQKREQDESRSVPGEKKESIDITPTPQQDESLISQ